MTQYIKGTKRLAIIKRWLQGIDDPEYDVLPTRKEGKYIVKKRETNITTKQQNEPEIDDTNEQENDDSNDNANEVEDSNDNSITQDNITDETIEKEKWNSSASEPIKPIAKKQPKQVKKTSTKTITQSIPKQVAKQSTLDSTVNLEILEQIKLLGDEIRGKRERKEQKQLIKHVVEKQLSKKKPQAQKYLQSQEDDYDYYSEEEEEQQQPIFKSRIKRR